MQGSLPDPSLGGRSSLGWRGFKQNLAGSVTWGCSVKPFQSSSSIDEVYFCKLVWLRRQGRVLESLSLGRSGSELRRKTPSDQFMRAPGAEICPDCLNPALWRASPGTGGNTDSAPQLTANQNPAMIRYLQPEEHQSCRMRLLTERQSQASLPPTPRLLSIPCSERRELGITPPPRLSTSTQHHCLTTD